MKAVSQEKGPPFDMPPVVPPSFPDRVFDMRDWGAVDDGETANTDAFRQAVEVCHESGGGVVLIPAGTWLTGPIHLRSNVNLRLEKDALVRFSTRFADYPPVVFTRWEGIECYNYSPLIYARGCENVAVTDEGTFDGQGQAWWHWKRAARAAGARRRAGTPAHPRCKWRALPGCGRPHPERRQRQRGEEAVAQLRERAKIERDRRQPWTGALHVALIQVNRV
jgi:polygalacturonase